MHRVLGFDRWVAQGGDWGSIVTARMALLNPPGLAAIHLNSAPLHARVVPKEMTDDEAAWLKAGAAKRASQAGYRIQQGTKPQKLAYGLTDSPVGLAAWILDKFQNLTVGGEPVPPPFPLDRLLTNVMLCWLGGINAANWLYISVVEEGLGLPRRQRVEVPTGFTLCPNDLGVPPPDAWLRRSFNMLHRAAAAQGGHFLAFEQPELFVSRLCAIDPVRFDKMAGPL
ncbi:hypothetical protein GI374_00280 [Paracoccus sp. S-4012]|uniref:alpha/beta hydrolase n=1 Tax=Paracoccus sp. S-4012 TaxID=2665648 RepID=UPI0012B15688|nr:alpha/beta hydrolase [Paracoccus sp. S-4012]MRX48898.1 hypothetical protein [Paracoccus sp. S-4012]